MSEHAFTRASWASFVAVVAVLFVVASCSGKFDRPDDGAASTSTAPADGTSTGSTTTESATTGSTATGSTTESTTAGSAFVPPADNPDDLAAWNQLETRDGQLVLADGVTPYTLNSPLFSDYAHKLRTVWIPEGAGAAAYEPDRAFDFPVGTVVTKTFYYPEPDGSEPSDGKVLKADPTIQRRRIARAG